MDKIKWFSVVLFMILMMGGCSSPVFASDGILTPVESEKTGSVQIFLEDISELQSKENVLFSVVKVADVIDGKFELKEEFYDSGIELNKIQTANELETVSDALKKLVLRTDYEIRTDRNGTAIIENLPVGVYLIYGKDIAGYEEIAPCLISIPTINPQNEEVLYDLTIYPKHAPIQEIISSKTGDVTGKYAYVYGAFMMISFVLILWMILKKPLGYLKKS